MDIDSETTRPLLSYFETSANLFPWRDPWAAHIDLRRALLGDLLIFDILLTSGGIRQPEVLYPPRDVSTLQQLLSSIEQSHYDLLKKDGLVYFLLKWHQDGREEKFKEERCIPPQFTALADAYWHLDAGYDIPRAVSILSDSRLNRDYASKIIQAISLFATPGPFICKYVRTAKPLLTEPVDLDIYVIALAESSFLEAWQFQRTFKESEEIRPRLWNRIVEWCVTPTPRPQALVQLLALPLSQFEQDQLHSLGLNPPPAWPSSAISIIQDLICTRLIQSGKFVDAIKIDHKMTSLTTSKARNEPQTHARINMVREVYSALPAAERALLELELDSISPKPIISLQSKPGADVEMAQPRDESRPPRPFGASIRETHPFTSSLPARAGAPRFGGSLREAATPPPLVAVSGNLLSTTPRRQPAVETNSYNPFSSTSLKHSTGPTNGALVLGSSTRSTGPTLNPNRSVFPTISSLNNSQLSQAHPAAPQQGPLFGSAMRKQNAFYQPPPPPPSNSLFESMNNHTNAGSKSPDRAADEDMDVEQEPEPEAEPEADAEVEVEVEEEPIYRKSRRPQRKEPEPAVENDVSLGYSVFGHAHPGGTSQDTRRRIPSGGIRTQTGLANKPSTGGRGIIPGAFTSDEDDDDGAGAPLDFGNRTREPSPPPQPPSPPRQSARLSTKSSQAATKTRTSARNAKGTKRKTKQPVAAAASDDEDGDDHAEERTERDEEQEEGEEGESELDQVAPLRARRHPVRKARSSTSTDGGRDDINEGKQTRRRSSRLSNAGSVHGLSPEPEEVPVKKARTSRTVKKTSKTTSGRSKRG